MAAAIAMQQQLEGGLVYQQGNLVASTSNNIKIVVSLTCTCRYSAQQNQKLCKPNLYVQEN
jgi:hypothetical protein